MTHDFRPGDIVDWHDGCGNKGHGTVIQVDGDRVYLASELGDSHAAWRCTLVHRGGRADPVPTHAEHPSRARAASSLRAASASLTTAIDHLTRAGEAETYPGQTVIRIRTASEETQACIQHATMAMYWLLHERLGS